MTCSTTELQQQLPDRSHFLVRVDVSIGLKRSGENATINPAWQAVFFVADSRAIEGLNMNKNQNHTTKTPPSQNASQSKGKKRDKEHLAKALKQNLLRRKQAQAPARKDTGNE